MKGSRHPHHRRPTISIARCSRHIVSSSASIAQLEIASQPPTASHTMKDKTLPPIAHCTTHTLIEEASIGAAVIELQHAVASHSPSWQSFPSGVVRLEVPIPRGLTAIRWLQGQRAGEEGSGQRDEKGDVLSPHVYFSGRSSSAPDTPETLRAEECTRGWSAVAGLGSAWIWQGRPGSGFDPSVMNGIQRFLSSEMKQAIVFPSPF